MEQSSKQSAASTQRVSSGVASDIASAVESVLMAGVRVGNRIPEGDVATRLRVSVIIPVYGKAEYTEKCLYAIAENSGDDPDYEVIVVDNGSTDWTPYLLHAMEGDLQVISNDRNVGFARACNQGAAAAHGEYLLFLNSAVVAHQGWLGALVNLADSDHMIGVVGAKLLCPVGGAIQHAGITMKNGLPDHVSRGVASDDPSVSQVRDFDMVTGACLLIRRELFQRVQGFDTAYLKGAEDVDLCLRVRDQAMRVVYCPDSVLDYHEGASDGCYEHESEDLQRLLVQWGHRFDAKGRFVRGAKASDPKASKATTEIPAVAITSSSSSTGHGDTRVFGNWEGPFFINSSLAHVNREFVRAIIRTGECELGLLHFDEPEFGKEVNPRLYEEIASRLHRSQSLATFHVRHHWPPNFDRTDAGPLILMQPWEFGRIPAAWLDPLRMVDRIWAYTEYVKSCYVDSGVEPSKVNVVPLGVEESRFLPDAEPLELPEASSRFRFLFVGGTLYRKGIDLLLEAYHQEFGSNEPVELIVKDMGVESFYRNQTAGEQIRQLQSDPSCAPVIYMTTDLPDHQMPSLYTACDALVHPYRGEGFGLPVAEAMACGLPVIVTRGGSTDDFCPDDLVFSVPAERCPVQLQELTAGQAWLLEPNTEALRAQMRYAFEHPEEARRRGQLGSDHIRTHFTWDRSARIALDQLEGVVQRHERAASTTVLSEAERDNSGVNAITLPLSGPGDKASPASSVRNGRTSAVLFYGQADTVTMATSELEQAIGPFDCYKVSETVEYRFGRQVNSVHHDVAKRRDYLVVIPSACLATGDQVGGLLAHLAHAEDIGAVAATFGAQGCDNSRGLVDLGHGLFPSASLIAFRTQALVVAGGFDEVFETAAVFANAVRCLRSQGWRVCEAGDVSVTARSSPHIGAGVVDLTSQFAASAEAEEMNVVVAIEEGDRLREEQRLEEAVDAYQRALKAKDDCVEAIMVTSDSLVEVGRASDAVAVVARLVELDSESSQAHNYSGLVHFHAEDWDGARRLFRRAIELQPGRAEAYVNLGVLEWEQERFEEAFTYFKSASEIDPLNRDLITNIGSVYVQVGELDMAVSLLREYLHRNPDDLEIQLQMVDMLLQKGDAESAGNIAESILKKHPQHAAALAIADRIRGKQEQTP